MPVFDGGRTGFDPYFHAVIATALVLGAACLGAAWLLL